jgi:hypothetical protein
VTQGPVDVEAARRDLRRVAGPTTDAVLAENRHGRLHPDQLARLRREGLIAPGIVTVTAAVTAFGITGAAATADHPGTLLLPALMMVLLLDLPLLLLASWSLRRWNRLLDGPVVEVSGDLGAGSKGSGVVLAGRSVGSALRPWIGLPARGYVWNGRVVSLDLDTEALRRRSRQS